MVIVIGLRVPSGVYIPFLRWKYLSHVTAPED